MPLDSSPAARGRSLASADDDAIPRQARSSCMTMPIDRAGRLLVTTAALIVVAAGVRFARPVLVPLLLAAFLATVTTPLVRGLRDHRVPAGFAVVFAVLVDLAALAVMGLLVTRSLVGVDTRLPVYGQRLEARIAETAEWLAPYGVSEKQIYEALSPEALVGLLRTFAESLAGFVSSGVLVMLIVVFMLFEGLGLREKLAQVLRHPEDFERMRYVTGEVNKYLLVKLATSASTGLLCGLWTYLLGVDFPVLWGLLAFLLNFIPTIGSIIAAVPPIALALVQLGTGSAFGVLAGYVAVNFTIGNFIEPRVMGRTLGLSPLVVFLSMVVWGWLLGPVGALLAVPITMIVKIACESSESLRWLAILMGPALRPPAAPDAAPEARRA